MSPASTTSTNRARPHLTDSHSDLSPLLSSQFKGDAPKKKKKRSAPAPTAAEEEELITGWTAVPSPVLALGPTYLVLPPTSLTGSSAVCLALQPTTGKIYPHPLDSNALASSADAVRLEAEDLEAVVEGEPGSEGPQDVHHVWVCTRIPDTEDKVTFRSGSGKFLASDELGVVSAEREARGMQEEWELVASSSGGAGVVIKSAYGKMLSVDVLAGGKLELRADEETEGENERWRLWMQGEYLPKAKKQLMERRGIKVTDQPVDDGLTIVGDLTGAEADAM